MKTKKTESKKVVVRAKGTGENYATAKDALAAFESVFNDYKHPDKVYNFLLPDFPDLAKSENAGNVKSRKIPYNKFFVSVGLLSAAFDAANKILDESGNDKAVINRIFNDILARPEIARAIDDFSIMPEVITAECLLAMGKASGGTVDVVGYSEIVDYFLSEYENELIDSIRAARGREKAKLERELENKRFEMFPICFNDWTANVRLGFDRFIFRTPLKKRFYPFHDDLNEPIEGDERSFSCAKKISDFAPDENGKINIPLRGGGGCRYLNCAIGWLGDSLKRLLGIEDREVSAPEIVPEADKPVSEYAARYVLDYQETPEARFTFKLDDGGTYTIDLEHSLLCHVNFIKRLIAESKTESGGWVKVRQPDWLNHRDKLPKTIKPFVQCVEKRDANGVSSFRITGKPQSWPRGAPIKKPSF